MLNTFNLVLQNHSKWIEQWTLRLISKNGSQKKLLNWTNQRVAAFFTKRWVENRLYLKFLIQEHTISAAIQESGNCGGSGNKASAYKVGDLGSNPG